MRTPVYKVVNDDDPNDYDYPVALGISNFDGVDHYNPEERLSERLAALDVRQSITIGGGAAVQFTITRIR